jgi:hypothetical protein
MHSEYKNNHAPYLLGLLQLAPVFFIAFFGTWTFCCHMAVILGISYRYLPFLFFLASIISFLISFYIVRLLIKEARMHLEEVAGYCNTKHPILLLTTVVAFLYFGISLHLYYITWLVLLSFSFWVYLEVKKKSALDQHPNISNNDISDGVAIAGLLLLSILCIAITLFAVREDADDAFYLSMVVQALDKPQLPVLFYESLNGYTDALMPMMRRVHSYELLVAAFSRIMDLDHHIVYYIIFPTITCVVFVLTFFSMYKRLLLKKSSAILALSVLVCFLLFWGEGPRTLGNFSFVRFFQGKCLLIQIFVPVIVYLVFQYLKNGCLAYAIMLLFVMISSIGTSVNGILIAPLTLVLSLLGALATYPKRTLNPTNIMLFSIIMLYPIIVAIIIKINPGGKYIQHFGPEIFLNIYGNTPKILGTVLGNYDLNMRSALILGCFLTLPVLLPSSMDKKLFAGYAAIVTITILLPGSPIHRIFAKNASMNFIWRLTWIVPFTFFSAAAIGALLNSSKKYHLFAIPILLIAFIASPGNWTFSKENKTYFAAQEHKYNKKLFIDVKQLKYNLRTDIGLLAPEEITVIMAGLRGSPPMPIVRNMYLVKYGEEKRNELNELQRTTVSSIDTTENANHFMFLLKKYQIGSVILHREGKVEDCLVRCFLDRGYNFQQRRGNYFVWAINGSKDRHI